MSFNLYKRELKALLYSPVAVSVITALNILAVVLLGVVLSSGRAGNTYLGFENVISITSIAVALLAPAVTIYSVTRDKRAGVTKYLRALPLSSLQITLSRLLALVTVFLIPIAFIAAIPLVISRFGDMNFLSAYLSVLMLALFEIFIITLSFMAATLARNAAFASVGVYLSLALSFVLGVASSLVRFLPFGAGVEGALEGFLRELSIFKKLDYALLELFDWTALLFFIIGIIAFVAVSVLAFQRDEGFKATKKRKNTEGKNNKGAPKRNLSLVLICVALLICVGVIPTLLPYGVRQLDVNKYKAYTPNESVEDYISSLDEEVRVYLIDPYTNEFKLHNAILRTLECGKNLKLEVVNSSESKDFLEKYGLEKESQESLSYAMIIESDKRWKFINGAEYFSYYNNMLGHLSTSELQYRYSTYLGLLNQYYEYYDSLDSQMQGVIAKCYDIVKSIQTETVTCIQVDGAIAEAIEYVTAEIIPTVYFLTGHGEEGTAANPLSLEKGEIPKNADVIIINSPSEDFSSAEAELLLSYLKADGKLYIIADKENYAMPNFSRLLAEYGLSFDENIITDGEDSIVDVSVNKSHKAFGSMSASAVTVKDVSEIITDGDKEGYTYTPMLVYKKTEGEGESAVTSEHPVAISVSEGDTPRIALFTGAITFNSIDNGIEQEALDRASNCVSNTLSWLYKPFEFELEGVTPRIYDNAVYVAEASTAIKIILVFSIIVFLIVISNVLAIVLRELRSKRALNEKSDD